MTSPKEILANDEYFANHAEIETIRCPICQNEYQHIQTIKSTTGEDDYQAWMGRGDLHSILFLGECGHKWSLNIGYHKGMNFAYIKNE